MSANEKDYSSYLSYESVAAHVLALFCGFTFTAITILVTRLPDPTQIMSQVTLFFLAFLLDSMQFILFYSIMYLAYCIKDVPPETKMRRKVAWFYFLSLISWGVAVVLMFLLWNLTYLALASGIMYALFTILGYIPAVKSFIELSRKLRSQK